MFQNETDQCRNFESNILKQTLDTFRLIKLHTTAYHHQEKGMVKRLDRSLMKMLHSYVKQKQIGSTMIYLPNSGDQLVQAFYATNFTGAYTLDKLRLYTEYGVYVSKGVGAGGARGAMAPTLFSKACFAPPPTFGAN